MFTIAYNSKFNSTKTGVNPIKQFDANYIKNDEIQSKIQLVEFIYDIIYNKICFIGLTSAHF